MSALTLFHPSSPNWLCPPRWLTAGWPKDWPAESISASPGVPLSRRTGAGPPPFVEQPAEKVRDERTVARSHCNARHASRAQQVNTPRVRRAFVENLSDAPRAQDYLSKLFTALSAIAARSAGTLPKNVHKF